MNITKIKKFCIDYRLLIVILSVFFVSMFAVIQISEKYFPSKLPTFNA